MKCKKSLMGLAALLILVFHFYIPITKSPIEMALYRASYIGVDLFFFVSAYSLGKKEKIAYGSFIKNRFFSIYVPFMIMALICAIYKKWTWQRLLLVISGAELFMKSGGAFMWFVPGIMIIYLAAPFIVMLKTRFSWKAFWGLLIAWLITAVVLQYGFNYTKIFILLNRIPIFIIGLFYDDFRKIDFKKFRLPLILIAFIAGLIIMYKWGAVKRLNKPLQEMYYLVAIPLVVSIVGLFDYVSARVSFRNLPLVFIGGFTLELYGLQMIFGYDIEGYIIKATNNGPVSFFGTMAVLTALAYVFNLCRRLIIKGIQHQKNK